jgi:hypothetical protein
VVTTSQEIARLNAKLKMRDAVLYALVVTILGYRSADDVRTQLEEFDAALEASTA